MKAGALLVLIAAFVLSGCEQDFLADGPMQKCTEVGAQCVLSEGPLGVCESIPCEAGEQAPCLVCVSQH